MDRRVLLIICLLSLTLAPSAVSAQGAAPSARAANAAKARDSVAVKDSVSAKPAATKVIDLDKLLADDEEGDLLTEEKPAARRTVSDSADAGQPSATADDLSAEESESARVADSARRAFVPHRPGRRGPPPSAAADSAVASAGPAVVEEGRTINFAQNLKEYRSPRLAMLLSLLVPGLGQAYSRSYVKASAFGAAEVAAIGVAVYLNSVAKSKKKDAYNFADKHFDVKRIESYDTTLQRAFFNRDSSLVFGVDTIPLPYDRYFYNAAKNKDTYYYESVRGKEFTPGWDDYNLSLADVLSAGEKMLETGEPELIKGNDGSKYELYDYRSLDKFYYVKRVLDRFDNNVDDGNWVLGHSNSQVEYNMMIDKSNSYRDAVNYMFYVILLNHIASAIDAGFTARAYNARLLGENNSVWNRFSVEQQFVFTGSELSPGVSLRLKF
jgi:hypothetical protein